MADNASKTHPHEVKLDVPYYSQFDPSYGQMPSWQARACGILAIKMVVDYWHIKAASDLLSTEDLLSEANVVGGRNASGDWLHSTLVMAARHFGFRSWRRGWVLSEDGRTRFEAEGADDETLDQIDRQQREESYHTLINALAQEAPVLVSVAKNFAETTKPHMIVLTGYKMEDDGAIAGFYYNDPAGQFGIARKNLYTSFDRFAAYWRYQGIFIIPKDITL